MTEVRKDASLHPKTVTKFSEQNLSRQVHTRNRLNGQLSKQKVIPSVWRTALQIARKDLSLIEVVSRDTVIVHNNSNWRSVE